MDGMFFSHLSRRVLSLMALKFRFSVFFIFLIFSPFSIADDYANLDKMLSSVQNNIESRLDSIIIKHSRLAKLDGEELSPSTLFIYSDPVINTAILQQNPLIGLDLPYRVLFYHDASGADAVTATTSHFIQKRYEFNDSVLLDEFDQNLNAVLGNINPESIKSLNTKELKHHYGMLEFQSRYDFNTTLERFKAEILGNNSDTEWFGEIDYTLDAARLGVTLPRMKLLLFGAPVPGAKAMRDYKKLGLDAFCQKVLLIEKNGVVSLYSNDLVDMARLHYGKTKPPHRVINFRLNQAYSKIVK